MNLNQISPETIALHCQYPPEIKNKLLRVAITLTQSSNNQDSHQIIDSLSNDLNIPEEDIIKSIGIYLKMINLLTHSADTKFNDKLTELGFSDDFVNDLPLIANRAKVMDGMFTLKQGIFNRLESLKWRVDISLIDSICSKKLAANVIFQIQLKYGQKYTITVDRAMFHKLRFKIALLIKEFHNLV